MDCDWDLYQSTIEEDDWKQLKCLLKEDKPDDLSMLIDYAAELSSEQCKLLLGAYFLTGYDSSSDDDYSNEGETLSESLTEESEE